MKFRTKCSLISLIIGTLTSVGSFVPAQAAQTINFLTPSPLKFSLSISSLETFAADGTVDRSLADYMRFAGANEEDKERFREILLKRAEIDPILFSRLLRTEMGEDLLSRWGQHIAIQGGRNGKYALRGALIQSAFDENGLSLINILRHLPTNIEIDLRRALSLANRVDLIITATNFFHDEIVRLAQQEVVNAESVDFAKLPDLRQPGEFGVEKKQWILRDRSRDRNFEVDVYQPEAWRAGQTPVVIISHGLSSSPQNFGYYAEHLASYGYVVAVPQHPGSDSQQLQDLKAGLSRQIFLTSEFVDRPKDLSSVIDELERRNKADFAGKLDLNRVAVIGHSFGGYTALAIAGATIDLKHLEQECDRNLNLSLLLQCRALSLELNTDNIKDERIKAIAITNPLKSAIFGPSGLASVSLPVFVQAGVYDPLTPFVLEQVRPFPWLNTSNKYLSVQEGDIHVNTSNLDAGIGSLIDSFAYLSLPESALLTSYNQAFLLAFLEVHLLNNEDFLPYLQSAYAEYLSQGEEFKNFLITNASTKGLEEAIARFLAQHPSLDF
ncbi:MAG: alpha/beta hydrolase [Xenococcus sp. MO_188.B8]|nr:alpha/beta hydrolase [Xenococcus sp. MO_188.B8]